MPPQALNLEFCPVTDESLAHLSSLTLLEDLNLKRCENITDAGLENLVPLTSLQVHIFAPAIKTSFIVLVCFTHVVACGCRSPACRCRLLFLQ